MWIKKIDNLEIFETIKNITIKEIGQIEILTSMFINIKEYKGCVDICEFENA